MIISSRSTQELKSAEAEDPRPTAELEVAYQLPINGKKRTAGLMPEKIRPKVITPAMIGKYLITVC